MKQHGTPLFWALALTRMELGTPEALQLLLLACTVAASYGVARSQIKRLLDDLASTAKEV